jgi:ParB family chromosome partitioning protein
MSKPDTQQTLRGLAEAKTEGVAKTTIFRVDPNLIKFEKGFNLRDEGPELDAHIEALYQAYKAGDMLPPVDAYVDEEGAILARDGHCRTRAAKRLRKEMPEFTIEVRQFRGNDTDAVVHMLNTGTGGRRLSPLEEGRGYLRLVKMGLTVAEIAEKRHVTEVTIRNGLNLAEMPAEVQKMVVAGEVSATTARKVATKGKDAVEALKKKVEENRKASAPEKKKKGSNADAKPAKKKVTDKALRGTAAERKPSKPELGKDEVLLKVNSYTLQSVVTTLRTSGDSDEPAINEFIVAAESALL